MSDNQVFNRKAALELLGNDESLLQILVDSFIAENKFEKSVLEKLISDGKLSEAASYVHRTKGAARQLCMDNLKDSGQALEDVLRGKTDGDIPLLVEKMLSDYEQAVKAVCGNIQ